MSMNDVKKNKARLWDNRGAIIDTVAKGGDF